MVLKIRLVVHANFEPAALVRLVESIDAQLMPYTDFDVTFCVGSDRAHTWDRLEQLALRRPNVNVVPLSGPFLDEARDLTRGWQSLGESESRTWVMFLSPETQGPAVRLLPETLLRLHGFASAHDSQVVAARCVGLHPVGDDEPGPELGNFVGDVARAEPHQAERALRSPLVLYRTDVAADHGLVTDSESAQRLARELAVISVYSQYPGLTVPGIASTWGAPASGADLSAGWEGPVLTVDVDPLQLGRSDGAELTFSIANPMTGAEYLLNAEIYDSQSPSVVRLNVQTAALGAPLASGRWNVLVRSVSPTGVVSMPARVGAVSASPAYVGDTLVVPYNDQGSLGIDMGATECSAVGRVDPHDVTVTESARGTVLTARLPALHNVGGTMVDGFCLLGTFKLPAKLAGGEVPEIECFVSGLAGTNLLSTQFGSGKPAPTGLNLVISGDGAMEVVPTPPPPTKPTAAPAAPAQVPPSSPAPAAVAPAAPMAAAARPAGKAKRKKRVPPPNESAIGKLRRKLPSQLEPSIRRLRRNKAIKRVYRKLSGLK